MQKAFEEKILDFQGIVNDKNDKIKELEEEVILIIEDNERLSRRLEELLN